MKHRYRYTKSSSPRQPSQTGSRTKHPNNTNFIIYKPLFQKKIACQNLLHTNTNTSPSSISKPITKTFQPTNPTHPLQPLPPSSLHPHLLYALTATIFFRSTNTSSELRCRRVKPRRALSAGLILSLSLTFTILFPLILSLGLALTVSLTLLARKTTLAHRATHTYTSHLSATTSRTFPTSSVEPRSPLPEYSRLILHPEHTLCARSVGCRGEGEMQLSLDTFLAEEGWREGGWGVCGGGEEEGLDCFVGWGVSHIFGPGKGIGGGLRLCRGFLGVVSVGMRV